jgi:hypothetical protein
MAARASRSAKGRSTALTAESPGRSTSPSSTLNNTLTNANTQLNTQLGVQPLNIITPSNMQTSALPSANNFLEETSTDDYQMLVHRIKILEQDKERREVSYRQRESAYKLRVHELDEEIAHQKREKSGWMKPSDKMGKLKGNVGLCWTVLCVMWL